MHKHWGDASIHWDVASNVVLHEVAQIFLDDDTSRKARKMTPHCLRSTATCHGDHQCCSSHLQPHHHSVISYGVREMICSWDEHMKKEFRFACALFHNKLMSIWHTSWITCPECFFALANPTNSEHIPQCMLWIVGYYQWLRWLRERIALYKFIEKWSKLGHMTGLLMRILLSYFATLEWVPCPLLP